MRSLIQTVYPLQIKYFNFSSHKSTTLLLVQLKLFSGVKELFSIVTISNSEMMIQFREMCQFPQ